MVLPAVAQDAVRVVGEPVRLAGGGEAYFRQPRWSPAGDRIAFTGSNYAGLWIADSDGQEARQLTAEPAAGFGYAWSGDGTALVARVARTEDGRRLHAVKVFDAETAQARQLTEYRTRMPDLPRWAPDDVRIVLPGRGTLEVFDTGRATQKQAPDSVLVLAQGDRIRSVRVNTGVMETLASREAGAVLNLVPSPDGSKVAFEVMGGDLIVMGADGSGRTNLGRGHRPRWSPDGRWVTFMVTEDDGHRYTASEIYAARADGSVLIRLTDTPQALEMSPDWSPDGQSIAYEDRGAIYRLPVRIE
jgi:Tol biopolymer transport system component